MVYDVTKQQLIELERRIGRPHVVVLGAGASLAAFPNGDGRGRRLPLMANIVEVLELQDTLARAGHDPTHNFEKLYSQLHALDPESAVVKEIEQRVEDYFSQLALPDCPTIYDLLVMSLRNKDAIFTFNWDPFLVDALERNVEIGSLPHIFHLHGNVRVGFCEHCGLAMRRAAECHTCGEALTPSRLLYPVEEKNYADDPFIASQWQQARDFIERAFIITIFGYSAPTTDKEAMAIFTKSWKEGEEHKFVERLETIDIRDGEELGYQWGPFAHFDHRDMRRSYHESMLARYPRRTCESLYHAGVDGKFVEPIPWAGNLDGVPGTLDEVRGEMAELIEHES